MEKQSVIIVEDELIVAHEMKTFLLQLGYAVPAVLPSAEEALEKIAELRPDLVLMDIKLKGEMNGIDAAGLTHALYDIPVVYLTANADEATVKRAKKTQPYGLIYKPVQTDVMRAVIEMALYKHRMEKQLRQREAWLDATLKSIGDAVIATDLDGRITFMNPVAEQMTGWKQDDCRNIPLQDIFVIIDRNSRQPLSDPVQRVISIEKSVELQENTLLISKDGRELHIADSASPILDSSGSIIGTVLVFRDVGQERAMRESLKQNRLRLIRAQRIANMGDFSWDVASGKVSWSEALYELLGYPQDEKIDFAAVNRQIHHPDDLKRVTAWLNSAIESKSGELPSNEYRLICKDGRVIHVRTVGVIESDEQGSPVVFATVQDISDRKEAEQTLIQSEQRYRTLFDMAPAGVVTLDSRGTVTSCNAHFLTLTGYTGQEIIGRHFSKLPTIIKQDLPTYLKAVASILRGKQLQGLEFTWKHRDGSIHYGDAAASFLKKDGTITGIQGIVHDITEKKQAERELQEIFTMSMDLLCIADITTATFIKINPAFTRLLGYSERRLKGSSFLEFIHPDDRERTVQVIEKNLKRGVETLSFQNRYRTKSGDYRWLSWNSRPKPDLGLTFAVARDVTEQKEREAEQQKNAAIIRSTSDAVITTDAKGTIISWNKGAENMYGYREEEIAGKPVRTLYYEKDLPVLKRTIDDALQGSVVSSFSVTNRHKNGSELQILLSVVPVFAEDGTIIEMVGIIKNITALKQTEAALREAKEFSENLVETANAIIITMDKDARITTFNRYAELLTGYNKQEVIGKNWFDMFIPGRDRSTIPSVFNRTLQQMEEVSTFQNAIILKNGRERLISWQNSVLHNAAGDKTGVLSIGLDITEQRRDREQLQHSEQQLRTLVEHAPDALVILDCTTGKFIRVNRKAERLFGLSDTELMNIGPARLSPPRQPDGTSSRRGARKYMLQALNDEYPVFEWEHLHRTGRKIPCEVHLVRFPSESASLIMGSIIDISRRKRTETILAAQRDLALELGAKIDLQDILQLTIDTVINIAGLDAGSIYLLDADNTPPRLCYSAGFPEGCRDINALFPENDPLHAALSRDGSVYLDSAALTAVKKRMPSGPDLASLYILPISHEGSRLGMIFLASFTSAPIDSLTRGLLEIVVAQIGSVILRSRMQQALRESQEVFSRLIATVPDTIIRTDTRGSILFVSEYGLKLSGYAAEEIIGQQMLDFLAPDDRQRAAGNTVKMMDTLLGPQEYRLILKDGSHLSVEINGDVLRDERRVPFGMVYICRDISERIKTLNALQASEKKYRDLFEKSTDASLIIYKDHFIDCNKAAAQMLGYEDKQAVIGKRPSALSPDLQPDGSTSSDKARSLIRKALKQGSISFEWQHTRANGEVFPAQVSLTTITREDGSRIIYTVWRDITERKRAEQQIQKELQEKEVMLKEIHHRVKNNLNVIISLLSLASRRVTNKEQALAAFQESRDRIYSMALVHEQLYKSRDLANIDMAYYIKTIAGQLRGSHSSGGGIKFNLHIDDIYLDVNAAVPCGLVLNELITNAYKYAFPENLQGTVSIHFTNPDPQRYQLIFSDDGIGIPDNVDLEQPSTLGLKLIRILTEQLNGSVTFTREGGTTVRFEFIL